ncbi:hypothetical protein BCR36DRAFT_367135 [Piromyces finnis]|uniref:Uncharacterized protein n=1 Tax=Piromyces finnis TaxID=1754191 RepID=A0A1Y1VJQ3_9FUNG|nr:hypothetical protein BCR36DRAFT_367135 [Piromyces finnis]|eukprot:ORX57939.1 hypothetical protein BCR36DRAFT_367135 [Piromyces finnis]
MRHKNSKTKAIIIKYIPLVILIVVHILVLFVLLLTNSIKSETKLDTANKEYEQCVHSRITILSEIFNVIYIIIGSYTAYAIRSLNERFKEVNKNINVYPYEYSWKIQ